MSTFPFQLPSGTNIIPDVSGINNLGSINYPFSEIYSKYGFFTNISGTSPMNILSDIILSNENILYASMISGTIISGNNLKINTSILAPTTPPTSGTADGTIGQTIIGNDGYLYGCSGTNLWGRIQLNTF